jgi:hypothetical protein
LSQKFWNEKDDETAKLKMANTTFTTSVVAITAAHALVLGLIWMKRKADAQKKEGKE